MRIAICDDEVSMVQILEEKIKKLLPDAVIDKYLSGDELIASGSKPDILFLDIQMPGMDGMETAKVLRQDNENMILIFVTAAEEYVFQAFDVGAFHYLVKPFSDENFKYVEKYDATCVTMKNGTALIAKKNYPEFVKQYLKYNQRKGNEVR